ncbi:hypothetical protein CPB83DRAFT_860323 [Crepidotus variabilis]|uniref:Uncharacterized protein n=1 Tax=Crepidotus variabilis TaxID=179855 RepID=A0A9P6E9M0_9AGAR|nr:hypothetical protein CPB83DRAFT_860323 [Crepidotus variabilis]
MKKTGVMNFGWLIIIMVITGSVQGHLTAWNKGMYCLNGTDPGQVHYDTNDAVQPLYQLTQKDWWFHHINKCDEFPPAPGDFLELPANGNFTVEHAVNRAFTTLSYGGKNTAIYGDGKNHGPDFGFSSDGKPGNDSCITEPNIHTQNETMAAGTVFAISYVSDLAKVTQENLVVFTVLEHTPWKRIATYQVPNLPACPDGGCICAWGWVPNGCGIPNMYMLPYRCKVTGITGNATVAPGVPPVWCETDAKQCVVGAKQMVYWHQLDGNNVEVDGFDLAGENKSPGYNSKMGFPNGAQRDIFLKEGSAPTQHVPSSGADQPTTPTKSSSISPSPSRSTVLSVMILILTLWI